MKCPSDADRHLQLGPLSPPRRQCHRETTRARPAQRRLRRYLSHCFGRTVDGGWLGKIGKTCRSCRMSCRACPSSMRRGSCRMIWPKSAVCVEHQFPHRIFSSRLARSFMARRSMPKTNTWTLSKTTARWSCHDDRSRRVDDFDQASTTDECRAVRAAS